MDEYNFSIHFASYIHLLFSFGQRVAMQKNVSAKGNLTRMLIAFTVTELFCQLE